MIGTVYVLKCVQEKWYVGYTTETEQRIRSHFTSKGSKWCQLYPPIQVSEVIPGTTITENEMTIKYMATYGYNNVRGGNYTKCENYKNEPKDVTDYKLKMLNYDLSIYICNICKKIGHFETNCKDIDLDGDVIMVD